MNSNKNVELFAKLERTNPGGSVKDRIAKYMIEKAEKGGELTKDKIILEATSGNTGIGLAMVAASKGYKITLVMSEGASIERRKIMEIYGAEIILTPKERGTDGAIDKVKELSRNKNYWNPNQFSNDHNVLAHYETTGEEIWRQTQGKITHFIAGMGTGGTLMGTGKKLKEYNLDIKMIGVEPHKERPIPGLKNMEISYIPKIFDETRLDQKIVVRVEDAIKTAKRLAKEEGLFVGISSGASMFGALRIIKNLEKGFIVVFFPDDGMKYLSTDLAGD
ncbi:MAG: cysteine synthase [Candidatus Aenigmarchaeota archaeon]|nr:cysteine synthase [Candidatus Aenigmarchaeota archaeon]